MAQRCVDQLMGRAERTEQEERRRTAVLKLRAERDELDKMHLATCTAGCRETRDEWPTDVEQAEADFLLVIDPAEGGGGGEKMNRMNECVVNGLFQGQQLIQNGCSLSALRVHALRQRARKHC